MRMQNLLLGVLTAGLAHAGAALAEFRPIEVKVDEKEIGVVEVDGAHLDAYREVLTKTLNYAIWARGDTPAQQGDTVSNFVIDAIENGSRWVQKYEGPLYEDWNKYRLSIPYFDVKMGYYGTRLAPINRCNDLLTQTTGAARKEFLYKGATITVDNAFVFRGRIPSSSTKVVNGPVTIKCLPLDHNPIKATLRIEPAKVEQVGKFLCPMELKLHGQVESREKFRGKALFVGPHYLSAITDLNYTKAGNRNITATYKINWKQMGGLTTAPNTEPKKQDLTFHLNVADQAGKLVRTPEERVQVSCRKIKSNAPTAGNGMTVKPAE